MTIEERVLRIVNKKAGNMPLDYQEEIILKAAVKETIGECRDKALQLIKEYHIEKISHSKDKNCVLCQLKEELQEGLK